MSTESGNPDPYEAVLADLRAQRDQIDQAIIDALEMDALNRQRQEQWGD